MNANLLLDRFEDACKTLGGELRKQGSEYVCRIRPHETASVDIVYRNNNLIEIGAENELATTHVRFIRGAPIVNITVNKDKKFVLFTLRGGDTCSLERQPKIVRGSCVIDGRIVDFSFDP